MSQISRAAKLILSRMDLFSRAVIGMPLRKYQLQALRPIIQSVLHNQGREFLLIFPRQSGKNEAVAHLLVYLLNLLRRVGGNIVYAAIGDGLGRGIQRLEARLENKWNHGRWTKAARPMRRILGNANVVFLSSHPQASARGETANWLLVIDELQDQDESHIEAVFQPMRAANNATALYIGTVRLSTDALWRKKAELEREEERDGQRRVFIIGPEQVIAENPAYGRFLQSRIRKLGRNHPIIASEYFLQPIDGAGQLFSPRRQALMQGSHPRLRSPLQAPTAPSGASSSPAPPQAVIACIDVGGQDEAATDPVARLANPSRDYTVATLFWVLPGAAPAETLPVFHAVDVFVDHGSRHFQDVAGRQALVNRLAAWLEMWAPNHILVDKAGVGEGISDWLAARFGRDRVTGHDLQARGKKAALGSALISLIETGRFKYWAERANGGQDQAGPAAGLPLSDGWWFWQQVKACAYDLPAGGRFERDLRWGVAASASVSTPTGMQLIHDDRLLSAALIAAAGDLLGMDRLNPGLAGSAVIEPEDPLQGMKF